MKNVKKGILAILTTFVFLGFSTVAFAAITGSPHDFSSGATWNSTGEICVPCHTPHHAMSTEAPLWNHEESVATYTMYDNTVSSTFDATPETEPDGPSKLCLSCHDGTVGLGNFGPNTGNTDYVTGTALLDTDLRDDHPVSFTYDDTLATTDGELYDPTTQISGLGGTIAEDMLFAGKVQCASCHDPHDNINTNFLLKSNASSLLCLTCHNK